MKRFSVRSLIIGLVVFMVFASLHASLLEAGQTQKAKKVNLNTATSLELQTISGIGPKVAQRIIDFREKNGKFKKIEEIMKVKGIGEKTFQRLKDFITVD